MFTFSGPVDHSTIIEFIYDFVHEKCTQTKGGKACTLRVGCFGARSEVRFNFANSETVDAHLSFLFLICDFNPENLRKLGQA